VSSPPGNPVDAGILYVALSAELAAGIATQAASPSRMRHCMRGNAREAEISAALLHASELLNANPDAG